MNGPRTPLGWLKLVGDEFSIGEDKKHWHTNQFKQAELERRLNGERSRQRTLRNQDLYDHANGVRTLSYCGNHRGQSMLCLDADGDPDNCLDALCWLRETRFPNLWVQKSNGGAHGFLRVDIEGTSVSVYKRCAFEFCHSLTTEVRGAGFSGVDLIEAKGLPADVWVRKCERTGRLRVASYKAGILGCLPRALFDDLGSVRKMPVLSIDDLKPLPATGSRNQVCDQKSKVAVGKAKHFGSGGGYLRLSQKLKGACRILVERKFGDSIQCRTETGLRNGKGRLFTTEHLSTALLVQYLQTRYPNHEGPNGEPWAGTTPVKQAEAIWRFLYSTGAVAKSWNPNVWTECKSLLTDVGMWVVVDGTYRVGTESEVGVAQKGGLDSKVVESLEGIAGLKLSGCGVVVQKRGIVEGEREEASLFITHFPPLPSLTPRQPHFGPLIMSLRLWKPPNPHEVDHLITHFEPPLALAA